MKKNLNFIEDTLSRWTRLFLSNAHLSYGGNGLAGFRFLFGLYHLLFKGFYWSWIAEMPQSLYNPHVFNFTRVFGGFPSAWFLHVSDVSITLCFIAITLGIKTRWVSRFAFLLILVLQGFAYSFGKIDHNLLSIGVLLVLGFSNAGCKLALWADSPLEAKIQDRATAFYAVCVAFGLFTSGFPKSIVWIDFDLGASGILRWYYECYYMMGRNALLAPYFSKVPIFLVEIADYIVPLFEASGFYFLLKSRKAWRIWVGLLSVFHLSNTLILNIGFISHIWIYGLFLIPQVLDRFWNPNHITKFVGLGLAIIFGLNQLVGRLFFHTISFFTVPFPIYLELIIWCLFILFISPYFWFYLRRNGDKYSNSPVV